MKRILAALAIIACLAAPAFADSEPYAVILDSATSSLNTSTGAAHSPLKFYALQVTGQDVAASAWSVALEGSLDGLTYTEILRHVTGDGDGVVKVSTSPVIFPAFFIRARVISRTLGSAGKIRVLAVGTQ